MGVILHVRWYPGESKLQDQAVTAQKHLVESPTDS